MSDDKQRAEGFREDATPITDIDTAAERIEKDTRATGGLGIATDPDRKSRTEEVLERAANSNDR